MSCRCARLVNTLITHFPADDNEVTEIIAVFFCCFFFLTPHCTLSENDRLKDASLLLCLSEHVVYPNNSASTNEGFSVKEQHVLLAMAF